MKLKELLRLIESNQKILINHGPYAEEFRGLKRHINIHASDMLERDVDCIYLDQDIYTKDFLKIRIKKGGKHESD